ncbi:MAG: HAD family phosphatase [Dactylosporangium sp.]|nr:Cof-type HAD-IIB family hydrolase [Dactylosporangium sp.]NNJ62052.1 HAD family phosphatase [Dactylosporangium sp.]
MLICCDNEGCIVDAKGTQFDLPALAELRAAIIESGWRFSICTGRSVPYVEAMIQVLGLVNSTTPCVCEGGGVIYHPATDRYEVLVDGADAGLIRELLPVGSYREELGKLTAYSVYPEPGHTVAELYDLVATGASAVASITKSIAAVDVTPKGVDKAFGLGQVLTRMDLGTSQVLAIGDSWNDLEMLRESGIAACPANAVPEVKAIADYVSPFEATRGVTDILEWAMRRHGPTAIH